MATLHMNVRWLVDAIGRATPEQLEAFNRHYDEHAAELRRLMPTAAAERRYMAQQIIERAKSPPFTYSSERP